MAGVLTAALVTFGVYCLSAVRTAAGLVLACGVLLFGAAPAVGAAPPVDPDVRVSPSTVRPGQQATASGDGFCSSRRCSLVAVYLDSRHVGSAAVTRQGTFAMTFRASVGTGSHRVTAVQSSPQGSYQASTSLLVRSAPTTTRTTTTTTERPTTTTSRRPTTSRSTTTTTTSASETSSLGSTSVATSETSSTSPTVLPGASPPEDVSSGYVGLLWWLVPSAVGALLVIGLVAWRQRPTGAHHEPPWL